MGTLSRCDMYNDIDYQPLECLLKQFTYKPGWFFEIDKRSGTFVISITAIDADEPRKTIPITFGHGIPRYVRESFDWVRWLRDMILEVEKHELDEFFRIGEDKPFYPHED
jgi:hypothetical protein